MMKNGAVELTRAGRNARVPGSRPGLFVIVLSVLYVALAMHSPTWVAGPNIHDDALFMQQAVDLINGNWLGEYNNRTLAKGPGYPLFLAFNFVLGLPAALGHALLHVAACAAFSIAMLRLSGARRLAVAVYLILLWHPALLYGRVIRDSIYTAQVLLVAAGAIHVLTAVRYGQRRPWLALATGGGFGWFWLTREEGIWLVPALVWLAIWAAWCQPQRPRQWVPLLQATALFVLAFASVNLGNRTINQSAYGVFVNTEFTGGEFRSALAALQNVQVGAPQPYVPVPQAARKAIYAQSPAFAELQWYLDNESSPGYFWREFGCNVYPSTCGDMAGGWFMWALRDAVAYEGYYDSASAADSYYLRLAQEVNAACESGELTCRHGRQLMPQMQPMQWRQVPGVMLRAVELLTFLRKKPQPAPIDPTIPPQARPAEVKRMLGRPLVTAIGEIEPNAAAVDWQHDAKLPPSRIAKAAWRVHRAIIKVYAILLPLLAVSGLVCLFAWAIKLWRRRVPATGWAFGVTTSLWGLLITRIAILAMVEISAFPGINPLYLKPAYALLCVAAMLSLYGCFAKSPSILAPPGTAREPEQNGEPTHAGCRSA